MPAVLLQSILLTALRADIVPLRRLLTFRPGGAGAALAADERQPERQSRWNGKPSTAGRYPSVHRYDDNDDNPDGTAQL